MIERMTVVAEDGTPADQPALKPLDGGASAKKNRGRRSQGRGGLPMLELENETTEDTIDVDAVHRVLAKLLLRAHRGRAS